MGRAHPSAGRGHVRLGAILECLVLPATVWLGYLVAGAVSRQPVHENRHARAVGHHPAGRAVRHQRRRALSVVVWTYLPGSRALDESKASRDQSRSTHRLGRGGDRSHQDDQSAADCRHAFGRCVDPSAEAA